MSLRLVLPDFRYRAVAPDGIVENEVCPVYFAELPTDPRPGARRGHGVALGQRRRFLGAAEAVPFVLSPWSVLQGRGSARARDLRAAP